MRTSLCICTSYSPPHYTHFTIAIVSSRTIRIIFSYLASVLRTFFCYPLFPFLPCMSDLLYRTLLCPIFTYLPFPLKPLISPLQCPAPSPSPSEGYDESRSSPQRSTRGKKKPSKRSVESRVTPRIDLQDLIESEVESRKSGVEPGGDNTGIRQRRVGEPQKLHRSPGNVSHSVPWAGVLLIK